MTGPDAQRQPKTDDLCTGVIYAHHVHIQSVLKCHSVQKRHQPPTPNREWQSTDPAACPHASVTLSLILSFAPPHPIRHKQLLKILHQPTIPSSSRAAMSHRDGSPAFPHTVPTSKHMPTHADQSGGYTVELHTRLARTPKALSSLYSKSLAGFVELLSDKSWSESCEPDRLIALALWSGLDSRESVMRPGSTGRPLFKRSGGRVSPRSKDLPQLSDVLVGAALEGPLRHPSLMAAAPNIPAANTLAALWAGRVANNGPHVAPS